MGKKKILLLLTFICCMMISMAACTKEVVEEEMLQYSNLEMKTDEVVLENDNLEFHFDPTTTYFYVLDKRTNTIWNSNPTQQEADADTVADLGTKKTLKSTLTLKYTTESTSPSMVYNYSESIENGLYNYEILDEDTLRVCYTIGKIQKTFYIPIAVPEERYMVFYNQFDSKQQKKLTSLYRKIDINKLRVTDSKSELLEKYPDLETTIVYELYENIKDFQKEDLQELFESIGYTADDYYADLEIYNKSTEKDIPVFNIVMDYTLTEDGFEVSVPMKEIQYKSKYPIVELRLLPMFGAGTTEDEGFIFVPDGSGAIINFNNGKTYQTAYKSDVYGYDVGVSRDALIDEPRISYPVFGISKNDKSFLCILEEGSSYASIEADISGRSHSYNYVAVNYTMIHSEIMDISAKSDKTVRRFEEDLPDEIIKQRYVLIDTDNYVDMATTYREYLMDKYPELNKQENSELPMVVEFINAIDKVQQVMGIPQTVPVSVTTYEETKEIIADLLASGVSNFDVKLNGWFNGGVQHDNPSKVKLISKLGGKKDFKSLVSYLKDENLDLYVEATMQYLYSNTLFDNFIGIRDAAKYVSRKLVELYPFTYVWYGEAVWQDMFYLTKPSYYLKNLDSFVNKIGKLNVNNISFSDIGNVLAGDYNPKDSVSREEAMKLQSAKLSELTKKGNKVMINTGNMYALPYASFITDVNLETKGYNIIDEEVPFYEIVIHGLIPYSGAPINLAPDYETNILRSVETGAGLYYIVMAGDSKVLQKTKYTKYFSIEYDRWSDEIKELYSKVQTDLGHVYNLYITDHKKLADDVYMTEYEDGTQVIVNYGESAYSQSGITVPAKNYIVQGGKQ